MTGLTEIHRLGQAARILFLAAIVLPTLAACGAGGFLGSIDTNPVGRSKFTTKEFGVAVSPRVTSAKKVPKGGGRYQVGKPYKVAGRWFEPKHDPNYDEVGEASWYGVDFHGRRTANGEIFDAYGLSAAHPTLPLPSYVRVTNLANNRSVVVRVNDRGPFLAGRTIDVSQRAAEMLGYLKDGTARVRVQYISDAPLQGDDTRMLMASFNSPLPIERMQPSQTQVAFAEKPIFSQKVDVAPRPMRRPNSGATLSAIDAAFLSEPKVDMLFYAADAGSQRVSSAGIGPIHVRLELGRISDPAKAEDIAVTFARIAAVELVPLEGGAKGAQKLRLSILKPGVTMQDVVDLAAELGLGAPVLY